MLSYPVPAAPLREMGAEPGGGGAFEGTVVENGLRHASF